MQSSAATAPIVLVAMGILALSGCVTLGAGDSLPLMASSSPLRLGPTSSSGWTNSPNALTDGDSTYAYTGSSNVALNFGGFASAVTRGPVSSVALKIDQEQVAHNDDTLLVSGSASGCSSVSASPSNPQPTTARSTITTALSCGGGWTWARVNALSATLTSNSVGGLLNLGVDGDWRVYYAWLEITYTDNPPIVSAGSDQTVNEGATVQLGGSASDPEGFPVTYSWNQVSGPTVTLSSTLILNPTFAAPVFSTNGDRLVVLRLSATDVDGQTSSATVTITVRHINRAPTANAGPDQSVSSGSAVSLLGSGNDPDGDSMTYQWAQTSGSPVSMQGATSTTLSFTAPSSTTTLVFSLRATDALGLASSPDEATIQVTGSGTSTGTSSTSATSSSATSTTGPGTSSTTTSGGGGGGTPSSTSSSGTTNPTGSSTSGSPGPSASSSSTSNPSGSPQVDQPPATGPVDGSPGGPCLQNVAELNKNLRFLPECGITAARVAVIETSIPASQWILRTRPLAMLPSDLPAPPSEATGFVEVTLETNDGTQLQPASIQLRLPVATSWRDAACPPRNCEILVWHYSDGIWTSLTAIEAGGAAGFTEYDVQAPSLSVFAIGTYKQEATMSAPMWQSWWPWILVGTVLASGGGAGWWALASRQRRNHYAALARVASKPHNGAQPIQGHAPEPSHDEEPPLPPRANADAKVSRLLKELKNNENLVQFVNNAAHDLANPLSPIQLQLHMLMSAANNKSDEKGKKSLEIVKRNVEQLAMLVTDLKDASRMQAGQMRLTPQPDDLGEIARKAVENFKEQAKGAEINLKFEGSQPLPVNADAGRLTQVLTNLINNALKFTPKGGSIRVMATQEETEALILVRDSGLGLTEDDRQRLFRPFSQVHGEQEKKKGTGLGLFISKGIIEGHGGTIGCESEGPGTGTTFWFSIPIRNAT